MIDTYGMDDINTQAIRELTTEVDRLKVKEAKDFKTNSDAIAELTAKPKYEFKFHTNVAVNYEVAANGLLQVVLAVADAPAVQKEGYNLKAIYPDRMVDVVGNTVTAIVVTRAYVTGTPSTIYVSGINLANQVWTIGGIYMTLVYELAEQ